MHKSDGSVRPLSLSPLAFNPRAHQTSRNSDGLLSIYLDMARVMFPVVPGARPKATGINLKMRERRNIGNIMNKTMISNTEKAWGRGDK